MAVSHIDHPLTFEPSTDNGGTHEVYDMNADLVAVIHVSTFTDGEALAKLLVNASEVQQQRDNLLAALRKANDALTAIANSKEANPPYTLEEAIEEAQAGAADAYAAITKATGVA